MAEMVDVYDCEGRPTGRSIPRDGAVMPAGEYLHYATAVVRDMEGRFLITQRPMTKSWAAGWWEVPGGGVLAGLWFQKVPAKWLHLALGALILLGGVRLLIC